METTQIKFKKVAAGDYESTDGRYRMYRECDVYPPAWTVEDMTDGHEAVIVHGAATMRDAIWIASQEVA